MAPHTAPNASFVPHAMVKATKHAALHRIAWSACQRSDPPKAQQTRDGAIHV
jgi:hypothetical protein